MTLSVPTQLVIFVAGFAFEITMGPATIRSK
ncbi:MAG: hypothetical protein QOD36_3189 [Mycobacterium sp.]|jgi:hypothetical protein|nr:hypothetical protein [Mycobacterium sp.]MDT5333633.1 hypothetical protein [Mycobacterium sp.]